jgi:hypothetical protein
VIIWKKKRGGVWYPEDRLRASLMPFAVFVPMSLLAFGVINRYVDGMPGLIGCLICLFFNGLGVSYASCKSGWQRSIHAPLRRWRWRPDHVQRTLSMSCTLEALRFWRQMGEEHVPHEPMTECEV